MLITNKNVQLISGTYSDYLKSRLDQIQVFAQCDLEITGRIFFVGEQFYLFLINPHNVQLSVKIIFIDDNLPIGNLLTVSTTASTSSFTVEDFAAAYNIDYSTGHPVQAEIATAVVLPPPTPLLTANQVPDGILRTDDLVFDMSTLSLNRLNAQLGWTSVTSFYMIEGSLLNQSAAKSTVISDQKLEVVDPSLPATLSLLYTGSTLGCGQAGQILVSGGLAPYTVTSSNPLVKVEFNYPAITVVRSNTGDIADVSNDQNVSIAVKSADDQTAVLQLAVRSWCDFHYDDLVLSETEITLGCNRTAQITISGGSSNYSYSTTNSANFGFSIIGHVLTIVRLPNTASNDVQDIVVNLTVLDAISKKSAVLKIHSPAVCGLPAVDPVPQTGNLPNKWQLPLSNGAFVLSNDDYTFDITSTDDDWIYGTVTARSGKLYQEFIVYDCPVEKLDEGLGTSQLYLGIKALQQNQHADTAPGAFLSSLGAVLSGHNPASLTSADYITKGIKNQRLPVAKPQIVMMAVDLDSPVIKVWFGLDGTWFNRGNPALDLNPLARLANHSQADYKTCAFIQQDGNFKITLARTNTYPIPQGYTHFM